MCAWPCCELLVVGHVGRRVPCPGGGDGVGTFDPTLGRELFGLSRVSLVLNRAVVAPPDDPVQSTSFLPVSLGWSEPRSDAHLVALGHGVLEPVQGASWADGSEVVTVDAAPD